MQYPLAPKQLQFVLESTKKWNLAHGSVRCGKTVGTLFRFMELCYKCPDSQIFMVGHTSDTIYQNVIRLLLESPQFIAFRSVCNWYVGKRQLQFMDKTIQTLGAKDEGAIGQFQGKTMSLVYCDEMTLYPDSIIDMIDTRLSNPWSVGIGTMNPSGPSHKLKQWIDKGDNGDPNYYALHYTLDDNPFVDESYKQRIRDSLSGLFYKRNYLGLWCLADGAIFDFFDRSIHVVRKPPRAADYWIAGIDYGCSNATACLIVGVSTGHYTQQGPQMWVEKEYYWDFQKTNRQKTPHELAEDIKEFLEPYAIKNIYIDPSALALKLEFSRLGMHTVGANNEVYDGIQIMTSTMQQGKIVVCSECVNLIREIEGYVWDRKKSLQGDDEPVKKTDHACVVGSTKVWIDGCECTMEEACRKDANDMAIKTFNGNDFVYMPFENPMKTGINKKIFKLVLENGRFLRATGDHKVYTKRGYIEIQNLLKDDEVLCYC